MFGLTVISRNLMPLGERELKFGMGGRDVQLLQEFLSALGLYEGPLDGKYGILTEEAVSDLQSLLYLPRDGVFGKKLVEIIMQKASEGGWLVHSIKVEETLRNIADYYHVTTDLIEKAWKKSLNNEHRTLVLPEKSLWIWAREYSANINCTGILVAYPDNEGEAVPEGVRIRRVVTVKDFLAGDSKSWRSMEQSWIIDGRESDLYEIKRLLKRTNRLHTLSLPWIWLDDRILSVPGALSYLNIGTGQRKIAGIIIHINPPLLGKKQLSGYRWMNRLKKEHLMLSIDLRPRLDLEGERRILNAKEARLWSYRQYRDENRTSNTSLWRMLTVRHEEKQGKLWMVDAGTLDLIYQRLVREKMAGVILEGMESADKRLKSLWQNHFVLEDSRHELALRDIYLKREKMHNFLEHKR